MRTIYFNKFIIVIFFLALSYVTFGQQLNDLKYKPDNTQSSGNPISTEYQFNGYTNYWHDTYSKWYRYGNLFKMSAPNVAKTILQSKVDVAEDMGVSGLILQEGFIYGLLSEPYSELDQPSLSSLETAIAKENSLIFVDPKTETGKKVMAKLHAENRGPEKLKSHQYGAADLKRADAFYLESGDRILFVVSSSDEKTRNEIKKLIDNTKEIIRKYDLHKGWFGAETLLKSVTCTDGHPLDVIGTGMNEGNSWFVFNGYMDFLAKDELIGWMEQVQLPVVTDVGFWPIFGCRDYDGLQVQSMYTQESWIDYAHEKGGYVFRQVWDTLADPFHYDGYLATEGNKEQIDKENVPFIMRTGRLDENALSSMVLFIEKDKQLTRESMWDAILDRREVGILELGKMMGPALYRNVLQMLLLDRVFLEEYFSDRINLEAKVKDYNLQVTVTNNSTKAVSGDLEVTLPSALKIKNYAPFSINLPAGGVKTVHFALIPTAEAMDNTNPVAVHYTCDGRKKSTLTMLDLPQAISVHRLLYAHAPKVSYPVTIHNFTDKSSFPVKVQVTDVLT
jgi:hypothetical protein